MCPLPPNSLPYSNTSLFFLSSCLSTTLNHLLRSQTYSTQEKDRNLRRITRMVLVVVAVFIVCWTPIHIFVIITALINIPSSTLQTITWHFCIALGYTNRYTPVVSLHKNKVFTKTFLNSKVYQNSFLLVKKLMLTTRRTLILYFDLAFPLCSSLNPVLYGYLDENFKRCFREFCTPSPSVLEMQNSSRTGATSRKLQQREHNSANTGERSNQQVLCVHIPVCVLHFK